MEESVVKDRTSSTLLIQSFIISGRRRLEYIASHLKPSAKSCKEYCVMVRGWQGEEIRNRPRLNLGKNAPAQKKFG